MARRNTRVGILLIVIGTVTLALLLLWLMGFRLAGTDPSHWFSKERQTERHIVRRPEIVAPVPTGTSELEEFYARHPRIEKRRKKEEELDTSLWRTDYYTSPEGVSWKKDSNSDNVLSETKKGEHEYATTAPLQPENTPQQSLHVEFWESPVKYKGYKLDRKQLIIFGISPDDALRFENHQDGIWMHHDKKIYLLKPNTGYMPFVERGATLSAQDSILAVQAGLAAERHIQEK